MYKDKDQISKFAKEAVDGLTKLGILSGYPDGKFRPKEKVNREEMATVVWRLYEKFIKN